MKPDIALDLDLTRSPENHSDSVTNQYGLISMKASRLSRGSRQQAAAGNQEKTHSTQRHNSMISCLLNSLRLLGIFVLFCPALGRAVNFDFGGTSEFIFSGNYLDVGPLAEVPVMSASAFWFSGSATLVGWRGVDGTIYSSYIEGANKVFAIYAKASPNWAIDTITSDRSGILSANGVEYAVFQRGVDNRFSLWENEYFQLSLPPFEWRGGTHAIEVQSAVPDMPFTVAGLPAWAKITGGYQTQDGEWVEVDGVPPTTGYYNENGLITGYRAFLYLTVAGDNYVVNGVTADRSAALEIATQNLTVTQRGVDNRFRIKLLDSTTVNFDGSTISALVLSPLPNMPFNLEGKPDWISVAGGYYNSSGNWVQVNGVPYVTGFQQADYDGINYYYTSVQFKVAGDNFAINGTTSPRTANLVLANAPVIITQNGVDLRPAKSGNSDPLQVSKEDAVNSRVVRRGGPVDTSTGAENYSKILIALSGLREVCFPITYNSILVGTSGDLGYGWAHEYNATTTASLDVNNREVITVHWTPHRANAYRIVTGSSPSAYRCYDPAVVFDVLTKTADGGFALTKPDQTSYTFTPNAGNTLCYLTQMADRNGRKLVIDNSAGTELVSITEPISGAALTFTNSGGHITQITDSAARTVKLNYDANGTLASVIDVNGNMTSYTYEANHRLLTATVQDGTVVTTNTYDTAGRVATQDDGNSGNQLLSFSYDEMTQPGKLVTTVTDRTGAASVYIYDDSYHLLSETNPLNESTFYTYDSAGNRTSVTDPLEHTTICTYDTSGNPLTATDAVGNVTTFTYDASNNVLSIKNADSKTATFTYDSNNNPLTSIDFAANVTTRTYDTNSELLTLKSPRGNTTTYTYTTGRLTASTDPLTNKTSFAYDTAWRLTTLTDAASNATTFTYSASGRLLTKSDALGNKTTSTYDVRDRLASVTDPLNNKTTYTYDANSNLVSTTDPLGKTTTFAYDGEDRLTKTTDPLGHATSLAYDTAGRLTSTTDALGNVVKFDYDAAGNRTATTDALGNKILQVAYDARNLPVTLTDALSNASAQKYDALGRVTQRTDPLGLKTALAYDALSRLTAATDPASQTSKQAYDVDGNRTSLTDPGANGLTFAFDKANRLASMTSTGGRVTTYTPDARGLVTGITKPSATSVALTYDAAGRLTKLVDPVGQIDYGYDAKGRLTSVKQGTQTISRTYDAFDRLVSFTDAAGNLIQYAYDAAGNLTTLTYPDGKKVTYAYDNANRLTTVTDWASRVTSYTYDANGRLTKTVRPNGTQQTRTYDKAGQLLTLSDVAADKATVIVQYTSTYDADGRLISEVRSPAATAITADSIKYTYGADNTLTSYSAQPVTHDADGNLLSAPLSGALSALTYDARDRLTAAGGLTYTYDAENRRVATTATAGKTSYVIDPNARLSRLLVTTSPSSSVTRIVYGLGALYQETDGTTVRYLHEDPRGNTVALSGAVGTSIGQVQYGPFGEIVSQTGDTATNLLYCGKFGVQTDANGLLNMRARYYHPGLGRFTSKDPIGWSGGQNLYEYCSSNPLLYSDPNGLVKWDQLGLAVIGMLGNGLGVIASGGLLSAPEPTMVTKVAGYALGVRSIYGFGANATNFTKALMDEEAVSKGSLLTDAAQLLARNNADAQRVATAIDLTLDLMTGKVGAAVGKDIQGSVQAVTSVENGFDIAKNLDKIADPTYDGMIGASLTIGGLMDVWSSREGVNLPMALYYMSNHPKKECVSK